MFKVILFCVSVCTAHGGFFDLTDVDDPFALLWNLPVDHKLSQCKISDNIYGMCMDKAKCLLTGGTPSGKCGLLFTCCSYDTNCVRTSGKKQSYFSSGNLNSAVTGCKYTIKLRNKNVCQVRLDFEQLILAPAKKTVSAQSTVGIYTCADDLLKINPSPYGVPNICGNNTGQHVYIHINQSTDPNSAVNIDINLANRLNANLPTPSWKIKFTQLECPLKRHKFDLSKFGETENINNDFNVLAPEGVIQYFTEPQGQIKSFGFHTALSGETISYPYYEHYTIAFRRPTNVCGIRFTPVTFNLLNTKDEDGNIVTCNHYLFVPEYYSDRTSEVSESTSIICTGEEPFYSLAPGPLYINFKAMDTSVDTTTTLLYQGFLINYKLTTTCP